MVSEASKLAKLSSFFVKIRPISVKFSETNNAEYLQPDLNYKWSVILLLVPTSRKMSRRELRSWKLNPDKTEVLLVKKMSELGIWI